MQKLFTATVTRIDNHPDFSLSDPAGELTFRFQGHQMRARKGETIASALFANGVKLFSRSFKYHRPRGLYDCQGQGPETLVTVDQTPNQPADRVVVEEGMDVRTQNAWPSVHFDLMAPANFLVPLLPNGFYYKMFHKPRWAWPFFEKMLRRAAGLGKIDTTGLKVHSRYEKCYKFPDVCIIGAGPAGLAATAAALEKGMRVVLVEENERLGGHCLHTVTKVEACQADSLNGLPEHEAVGLLITKLRSHDRLEVLLGTSAFGLYEDNLIAAQRGREFFKIRARSVVLAPGADDRFLVFENNDKPGIMTARGVERLIALDAIRPGRRAVVVINNDGGYHTARLLHGAGTQVAAVVDARPSASKRTPEEEVAALGISIHYGQTIHSVSGWRGVRKVRLGSIDGQTSFASIACDLVVLAVGYQPRLNLLSMGGRPPVWDLERQILRVKELPPAVYAAGEVNGHAPFSHLFREGWNAGEAAATGETNLPTNRTKDEIISALPADIASGGSNHFICKCMDVTRKEFLASIAEGFDQIETLKRYSSVGMGPCQGKICHEVVARLAALDTGLEDSEALATTMRPPVSPVTFGVLAGGAHHLAPERRTAMHDWHARAGATFLNAGEWKRPHSYGDPAAEAEAVRKGLGIIDVSTLGKLGLRGPDVLNFLHFVLPGSYRKLGEGRVRYKTMVGEDGVLFDDGTLSHLAPGEYYLTTTTGNHGAILSLFRWWLTTLNLKVHLTNLGPVYAAVNLSGPSARTFLQELVERDLSNEAFPYMSCCRTELSGAPVMLFRIGFTGELSYEVHFPSEFGESMWEFLMSRGKPYNLKPFGVEAQRILRLEKGHLLPGVDTDALSNPYEAGTAFTIREQKQDFVGKAFLADFKERGAENRLVPYQLSPTDPIPDDGVSVQDNGRLIGRVTSSRFSPALGRGVGLAWVLAPYAEVGSRIQIQMADGRKVWGEVLAYGAYDPEGLRLKS